MRLAITGGTGLIGRHLLQQLLIQGHEPIVLTRHPNRLIRLPDGSQLQVPMAYWDPIRGIEEPQGIKTVDGIIHLAGESIGGNRLIDIYWRRWSPEVKQRIVTSRVATGRALVRWLTNHAIRPKVFIQASAIGFYGPRGSTPVTELDQSGTGFLAEVCRQWEASTESIEQAGVRRIIIRIGLVLAHDGGLLPVMSKPVRYFLGAVMGSGNQGVSWIHVHDLCRAISFLIENESISGPVNLVAPGPVSHTQFMHTLARVLRRPCLMSVPAPLLRLLLGEKADLLLDGQYVLPSRLLESGFTWQFPELEAALTNLLRSGHSPR